MKRLTAILLVFVMILTACGELTAEEKADKLLNMTDEELFEWLKDQGVEIPGDDYSGWERFAHSAVENTIEHIDEPNYRAGIAISYTLASDFGNAISDAVRNYLE